MTTDYEKSRADAPTGDQRQALGESISEYFGKLDSDEGIRAPEGRILRAFDYCDSRNVDDLIDRAIVPAIAASPVEQHEVAPAEGAIDPSEQLINFSGHSLTLTGAQLLEALDFIAPDRDRDQLESELTFQRGEGHAGKGMYCWVSEYPEEGAIFVDGSTAIPDEVTLTADEVAALHVLNEKLRYVDDMGPADEGWQSDKLNAAWKAVDAVLARAQNANKTVTEEATERALTQAIDERDQAEEAGTRLAEAVGEFLGVDVGEWSSANNPILTAINELQIRADQPAMAAAAPADERAECIAWANANGFTKYHESMCAAWEERARRAAASPAAEDDNSITLDRRDLFDFVRGAIKSALQDYEAGKGMVGSWYLDEATNRTEAVLETLGTKSPYIEAAPQPAQADAPAEAREPVCKLCRSPGPDVPCAYPTEINRQQAKRIAELESRLNVNVDPHPDDVAVDSFAAVMKHKLALARDKGRGGWETCSPADLSRMLREHVEKGDPRDVANFCAFLWNLRAPIVAAAPADELAAMTARAMHEENKQQ
ncbi:hypothetical protein [Burkholderia ubonensis]|uniref:hypothetical protein n=1 Tax=Burkholderia ubonensis TaxID=101571 RepID=UPI0007C73B70|nr:hypothetical protein [Burkholderia ubonensis]